MSFTLRLRAQQLTERQALTRQLTAAHADTLKVRLMLNLAGVILKEKKSPAELVDAQYYAHQGLSRSKKINDLTLQGNALEMISSISEEQGDRTMAREMQKSAIQLFLKVKNLVKVGDAYRKLGRTYDYRDAGECAERIRCDSIGLSFYVKTNQFLKQGFTLESLGDLNRQRNAIPESIIALKQALLIFNKIHFPRIQGVLHYLNQCYEQIGDLKQALYYGLEAVKTAETLKDSSDMMNNIYNYVGKTYHKTGQIDQAIQYLKLGLAFNKDHQNIDSHIALSINLTTELISVGRFTETAQVLKGLRSDNKSWQFVISAAYLNLYTKSGRLDLAGNTYQNVLSGLRDPELVSMRSYIFQIEIAYLFAIKKYSTAREEIAKYDEYSVKTNNKKAIQIIHQWLFRLDSAQQNYVSAIRHLQSERLIRDSLLNETKVKSIAQLEVLYGAEKREQQLMVKNQSIQLLTKQSQLQKADLRKETMIRNFTISGILLFAILLIVSYSRYRIKQRSNLLLQRQQKVINKKNSTLEHLVADKDVLLQEKEWLLKEIHHRVKNNLQIVISLLNSQSIHLDNETALEAIRESQHRMYSISLIHQKLYQSDNLASIDMFDYITELTDYLKGSFGTDQEIIMDLQVEPINLDVVQAVPLGLILNEALTNAFKYAFVAGQTGRITIALDSEDQSILLTVADNGRGLPADFDPDTHNSLGMTLMKGLASQLQGVLKIRSKDGLTLSLKIPAKLPLHMANDLSPGYPVA